MLSKDNIDNYFNLPTFKKLKEAHDSQISVTGSTFDNATIQLDQLILYQECIFHNCKFEGTEHNSFFYRCNLADCEYPEEILTTSFLESFVAPDMLINTPMMF